jgi:hypothetical protein
LLFRQLRDIVYPTGKKERKEWATKALMKNYLKS